jgi:hypothetical protein
MPFMVQVLVVIYMYCPHGQGFRTATARDWLPPYRAPRTGDHILKQLGERNKVCLLLQLKIQIL